MVLPPIRRILSPIPLEGDSMHSASSLANCALLQIPQPLRHLRQSVTQRRQRRDVQTEIVWIDLIEGIGIGVVPIEIVRSYCAQTEARHTG